MIEELRRAGWPTGSRTSSSAARSTTALSAVRRAELHLRVGEALERSGARSVADLAHHFAAAAPFGGVERGVEYNVRAARAASDGLDFDAAAERLRRRARARRRRARPSAPRCCSSSARPGTARAAPSTRCRRSPRRPRSRPALGDAELLARAAIGYEEACWRPVIADQLARRAARARGRRARRRAVAAAGRRARRARPRARDPRRARARGAGARRGGRDGAAARRPPRARPRAGRELLGPRDALAAGDPGDAHRGARHRRRARRRRAADARR